MTSEDQSRRVFHVGPWRYLWVWFVFGPLALVSVAGGLFSGAGEDRTALLIGGALWLLVPGLVTLLVRTARLEISAQGITLKQLGFRLEAPWQGVSGLRLDRGHEGFITAQPVGGKGAGLLAAAGRAMPHVAMQFYDDEQQTLLDQHRLIPIEAFVWHLRHGTLRQDIERYAPQLRADLALFDKPRAKSAQNDLGKSADRQPSKPLTLGQWAVLSLIPIALGTGVYLAMSSERTQALAWQAADIIFPTLFALRMALVAADCFRRGARLAGWGLSLVSALLAIWALGGAFGFAQSFGVERHLVQAVAALIPIALTLLAAYGARNALRRHSRVLGALLCLLAAFLTLWALAAGFEFVKLWR